MKFIGFHLTVYKAHWRFCFCDYEVYKSTLGFTYLLTYLLDRFYAQ